MGKLFTFGIGVAPNKSTLSMPISTAGGALRGLALPALGRFRDEKGLGERKRKFRFKNKLLSLDSTTISLCLEMFLGQLQRAKRGVKAHVLLDHDDYMPSYVPTPKSSRSDVKMADAFPVLLHRGDGSRL